MAFHGLGLKLFRFYPPTTPRTIARLNNRLALLESQTPAAIDDLLTPREDAPDVPAMLDEQTRRAVFTVVVSGFAFIGFAVVYGSGILRA